MTKRKLNTLIGMGLSAMLIGGCMSTGGHQVAKSQEVNLPKATIMPSAQQLSGEGMSVVVLPVETGSDIDAKIGEIAYDQFEGALLGAGNRVIERDLATKMQDELRAAELSGRYNTDGIAAADIALFAKISGTDFNREFTERSVWYDDDGDRHVVPPKCEYNGHANINVRAYKLPDMTPVGTYVYDGASSFERETSNSSCPVSAGEIDGLKQSATRNAIDANLHELLTSIAPNFYVIARRDLTEDSGTSLFRVNLGSRKGAREDAEVTFYRMEERVHPITGAKTLEPVAIGNGTFTADIGMDYGYVLVDEPEVRDQIRLGNVVRLVHSRCGNQKEGWLGVCWPGIKL
ncbi:hypothetical protein CWI84_06335 [Idiomarina tyrosinivorans]|uniref:Lipoprotein n=1 Tax=Idiomarina tyrosinivorans TaxID=1445662 RepID=A0A432ZQZ0_9GAMM|nr:hypothetical protein [Idiomarina tyrosinivorans]RUO80246.1 hypothetical protein CWI84_06335 [Idiomarina tyrosinivorans]